MPSAVRIDGGKYGTDATCNAAAARRVRSGRLRTLVAGPAAGDIGTALTYIPFGRDGVSFAAYRAAGAPVTSLTRAQTSPALFTTGPQVIGGVRIVPCGIQVGSGTYSFWNTVTTATAAQENTATTECNNLLARARWSCRGERRRRPEGPRRRAGRTGQPHERPGDHRLLGGQLHRQVEPGRQRHHPGGRGDGCDQRQRQRPSTSAHPSAAPHRT